MQNLTPSRILLQVTSLLLLYLVPGCSGKKADDKAKVLTDSTQITEDKVLLKDELPVSALINPLESWVLHWKAILPEFSLEEMESIYAGQLPDIRIPVGDIEITDHHRSHFVYAPDNIRYVDLYSYKVKLQQGSAALRFDFKADSQAVLYDEDEEEAKRLLFMGPVGGIEAAFWLNDDELFISGFGEREPEMNMAPIIWHFKLAADSVYSFQFPKGVEYATESYLMKQFKPSEGL